MHAYDAMLFVHILGVVLLFGAITLTQVGVTRLGRVATLEEMRLWVGMTQIAGRMFPISFVLILIGGLYMAGDRWSFGDPWIVVALASLVLMGALGGGVLGRTLESVGRSLAAEGSDRPAAAPPDFAARLSASLRPPMMALAGVAIGVLWLMTNKPGWFVSIAVVAGLGLVGAAVGVAMARRGAKPSPSG
jgi:hypothetical protein